MNLSQMFSVIEVDQSHDADLKTVILVLIVVLLLIMAFVYGKRL